MLYFFGKCGLCTYCIRTLQHAVGKLEGPRSAGTGMGASARFEQGQLPRRARLSLERDGDSPEVTQQIDRGAPA